MDQTMTLQEGLAKFSQKNKKYFSKREYSTAGQEFMKCHDIAHVIFGCDTSLLGEGTVKIWTTFGTTASFIETTKGYREAQAFELFKAYRLGHFMRQISTLLIRIPGIIFRSKRMVKPWPFKDYSAYLSLPICAIRKEFGIKVF